jgi:hypothetical protein
MTNGQRNLLKTFLLSLLVVTPLRGQARTETFKLVISKVRSETVALHVPHSSEKIKVDGFRIWAESKTARFELAGSIREPMSQDECKKSFNEETCKMETIGRPEVGKEYGATRTGSDKNMLCLFDPRKKAGASDCYQIELEEAKK